MQQRRYITLLLALAMLVGACETSFDPLTESQTEYFAVFGFLKAGADTQFVRVSPLRPLLDPASQPAGTRVSTTEGDGAAPVAWRDSLVRLDDGATGLLFYAPFRAEPGTRYRLEVRGPDDAVTRAATTVPPIPPFRTDAPRRVFNGNVTQTVRWLGLTRQPSRVTLAYRVRPPEVAGPDTTLIVTFGASGAEEAGAWTYPIDLTDGRREILQRLQRAPTDSLVLLDLQMEIEVQSEEWLQREAPVNIENGFGFFGAVGTYEETWTLDAQGTRLAGFSPP